MISQKDSAKLKPYIYSLTKIALCKSGTVNMELALHGIPQIVGYRVSRITAFIAKKILNFKVKFLFSKRAFERFDEFGGIKTCIVIIQLKVI